MEVKHQTGNVMLIDGVPVRKIGGKYLVTYVDISNYTGYKLGTVKNKIHALGLRTYRLGKNAAIEKADADRLVLGVQHDVLTR